MMRSASWREHADHRLAFRPFICHRTDSVHRRSGGFAERSRVSNWMMLSQSGTRKYFSLWEWIALSGAATFRGRLDEGKVALNVYSIHPQRCAFQGDVDTPDRASGAVKRSLLGHGVGVSHCSGDKRIPCSGSEATP